METLVRVRGAASAGPQTQRGPEAHMPGRPQPKEPLSDPAPSPEPGPEPRQPGPAPSTEPVPEQDPDRDDADTGRGGLGRTAELIGPSR